MLLKWILRWAMMMVTTWNASCTHGDDLNSVEHMRSSWPDDERRNIVGNKITVTFRAGNRRIGTLAPTENERFIRLQESDVGIYRVAEIQFIDYAGKRVFP